ncbi:uncharacterized protein A4U43_C05F27240 [Asparagus officinalis]|uniref:Uncharacterized protein n=1 Tax=Asparagus officinalis TaxID=4686 RepID=A0A5P1EV04_ASPOF|nr:uncharacterized protein A4U43_C05F27240 [Asparagus officinalis]
MELSSTMIPSLYRALVIHSRLKFSYGTAGFRAEASMLTSTVFRAGILAALRSLKTGAVIGLMITASHNPVNDNGVKIADPDGGMLTQQWEPFADALANAPDPKCLLDVVLKFIEEENITVRCLVDLVPKEMAKLVDAKLVVDGANGVGGGKLEELKGMLTGLEIEVRNLGRKREGVLNENVGADHVQKEKVVPYGFGSGNVGIRCASLDGDADRLVYFRLLSANSSSVDLVDGDKILSLFAIFIKEQLDTISRMENDKLRNRLSSSLGIVQTAYANGCDSVLLFEMHVFWTWHVCLLVKDTSFRNCGKKTEYEMVKVADRSAVVTANAETQVVKPLGLQELIYAETGDPKSLFSSKISQNQTHEARSPEPGAEPPEKEKLVPGLPELPKWLPIGGPSRSGQYWAPSRITPRNKEAEAEKLVVALGPLNSTAAESVDPWQPPVPPCRTCPSHTRTPRPGIAYLRPYSPNPARLPARRRNLAAAWWRNRPPFAPQGFWAWAWALLAFEGYFLNVELGGGWKAEVGGAAGRGVGVRWVGVLADDSEFEGEGGPIGG